jgi:hypothetical protein
MCPTMEGWIDEVEDGWVYGRYGPHGLSGFVLHILDIPECQRVDLAPGMYCTFVNGNHLLIHKTMRTTHDIETASAQAKRLYEKLGWGSFVGGQ